MKDCFDVARDIRSLINVPEVLTAIDGDIWQFVRPINSDRADIVIGVMGIDNDYIQNANVNVLIHVPNIQVTKGPLIDWQPDQGRFNALCDIIAPLLDNQYKETFHTNLATYGNLFRDKDGSWFCLLQVEYYSIQDNYKLK